MRDGEPEVRQGLGEGVHGNRAWSREDKRGVGQQRSRTETGQREEGERNTHHLDPELAPHGPGTLSFSRSAPCLVGHPVLSSEGSSLVYSPGLGDCISMSPFPLLAPLDILPFTATSLPPLCSNTVCCLPASLPIDPKGPSLKASHRAMLCIPSRFSCSGDIPSVNITASVQEDAVHGCL